MADRYSESERFGRRFRDQDDRYREQWQGSGPRHHDEGAYGYTEREQGRGRGERDDRGFFDRAGDEVRSWFGDDEAQRRRMRDEAEYGGREGYGRPRSGDWWQGRRPESRGDDRRWGGFGSGYSREEPDRDWARQWGHVERGQQQQRSGEWGDQERYGGSSWTSRGGYGGEGFGQRSGGGQASGYDMWAPWATGGGPYAGRGPKGYQRADERIKEDICERMSQHGQLDASDLEVRVVNGEVTLEGTVNDRQSKRLAEDIVEGVMGVREVHNQVRVTQGMYGQQGQAGQTGQPGQQTTQGRAGEQRNRAA